MPIALVLQGKRDTIVPARNLRLIQQQRPDVQVAVIDSSHMVLQERASESAKVIAAFAASLLPNR